MDNYPHINLAKARIHLGYVIKIAAKGHITIFTVAIQNTFSTAKAMKGIKLLPFEVLYTILHEVQSWLVSLNVDHIFQFHNV